MLKNFFEIYRQYWHALSKGTLALAEEVY